MKTTIELPNGLLQRLKILAVQEHRRFKDMVAEVMEIGLQHRTASVPPKPLPKLITLRGGGVPTAEEVRAMIAEGRD